MNKENSKPVSDSPSAVAEPVDAPIVEDPTDKYSVEVVRDYYGKVDPFYLSKKDPNYEYRFLYDNPKNLSLKTGNMLFQKGGWQIVPRDHLKKLGIKEREISPDGVCRRGDTILARIPKELFLEKEKYKKEQAMAPMKTVKRLVEKGDKETGGKGMHESMRGIETQKQLGM